MYYEIQIQNNKFRVTHIEEYGYNEKVAIAAEAILTILTESGLTVGQSRTLLQNCSEALDCVKVGNETNTKPKECGGIHIDCNHPTTVQEFATALLDGIKSSYEKSHNG